MSNYTAVPVFPLRPKTQRDEAIPYRMTERALPHVAARRPAHRFSLRMALKCRSIESRQTVDVRQTRETIAPGESLKISSKELLFTSTQAFLTGQVVEVFIDWPVLLENGVRLTLVVAGRVTRRLRGVTTMQFDRYQFRTRGRSG